MRRTNLPVPNEEVYRISETEIVMLAVALQKRRPGYWFQSSDADSVC
jgi:hypothetical protein